MLSPLLTDEATYCPQRSAMLQSQPSSSLKGMERRIPTFQSFIRSVPANSQKALPPDPPAEDMYPTLLKRSSSVYTRATGVWDTSNSSHGAPSTPTKPTLERWRFSASSPQLSIEPLEPLLCPVAVETTERKNLPPMDPRMCSPLLPSPSPSLTTASGRNSYGLSLLTQEPAEDFWATLAHSPPFYPSAASLQYSQSSLDVSSAPATLPSVIPRARSASPPAPQSRRLFGFSLLPKPDEPKDKELASLGYTAEATGVFSGVHSKKKALPLSLEYTHHKPKENMTALRFQPAAEKIVATGSFGDDKTVSTLKEPDVLSADYHRALVDQYRELTESPQSQWDDLSDGEDKGRELRLVPAPLFWKNRQQELYPKRVEHFLTSGMKQQNPKGMGLTSNKSRKKKQKMVSNSAAPLKMILASHLQNKREEKEGLNSPSPKTPSRLLFRSRNRATSRAVSLRRTPSNNSSRSTQRKNKKQNSIQPLLLHLPAIAYSPKSASESQRSYQSKTTPRTAHAFSYRDIELMTDQQNSERSRRNTLSGEDLNSMRTARLPSTSLGEDRLTSVFAKTPKPPREVMNAYTSRPGHNGSQSADTTYPQAFYHQAKSNALYDPPIPPPKLAGSKNTALHSVFDKACASLSPKQNAFSLGRRSHARTTSSMSAKNTEINGPFDTLGVPYTDVKARDEAQQAGSSLDATRGPAASSRPKFIEKALEAKRQRERQKQRKNLKASIKFVGQTDPNLVDVDRGDRSRRETFGAGWI